MKRSLLDIVQEILNDMVSDEVNSIDDTVEAQQVASIVKSTYFEMMSNRLWPHMRKLIQLDASNDISKPTYLKLPPKVLQMEMFKYETISPATLEATLQDIKYRQPEDFLRIVNSRLSTAANVVKLNDYSGVGLRVFNDTPPTMWTSFDDVYIVTDAYQGQYDDTLKASKSQCMAYISPSWAMEDSFIPDLPYDAFAALVEEAKSTAFFVIKQMVNQKSELKAARQNRWLSRKSWRAHGGVQYSDFGRKNRR